MISRFIYTALMMCCAVLMSAQSVSVQVAPKVEAGRKFQLTIVLKDLDARPPENVALPGCTLIFGPALSTSQSFSMINGKTTSSSSVSASYTFRADKEGTVDVPSFSVTGADGKKYTTKPQKITVLPAGQHPSSGGGLGQYTPPVDVREGEKVDPKGHFSADDMFVRIIVDNKAVYEQEPIVATIKLYTRQSIRSFQMITQPTFEGFLSEELDVNEDLGTEVVNGKEYRTAVMKRCVLYPQKTGKLKLTSGTYEVTLVDRVNVSTHSFFPDFRLVEKQIHTPESVANINVSALPEPKPSSFDGAVGDFHAQAQLSSTALHTNEPATYTLKISGTGNIKYLKTPDITMPPGIDLYTPQTDIDASYAHGNIEGTYTVTYTFVPMEVGTFEIPPYEFSYFNPATRQYKTVTLPAHTVKVAKGLGASTAQTEQKTISDRITDIRHIKAYTSPLVKRPVFVYTQVWYWAMYAALALALVITLVIYRRQLKLNADVKGRRLARALRKAMKRFKVAKRMMDAHESEKFYAEINRALWGYLSDKLSMPSSQLLRENVAAQLSAYGVDQEGIDDIITILDECEMARFTPAHSDADMAELYNKVVVGVKSIENVKK